MLICYCICIGLVGVYWLVAAVMNHRREVAARIMDMVNTNTTTVGEEDNHNNTAEATDGSSEIESLADFSSFFADLTDFQQREFRYTT
jgi:ACS family allantoate permease-like MFS transporter